MDWMIALGVRLLQIMFVLGVIGSAVVLILAAISEARIAFSPEEEERVDASSEPA